MEVVKTIRTIRNKLRIYNIHNYNSLFKHHLLLKQECDISFFKLTSDIVNLIGI